MWRNKTSRALRAVAQLDDKVGNVATDLDESDIDRVVLDCRALASSARLAVLGLTASCLYLPTVTVKVWSMPCEDTLCLHRNQ
jgi:hypothetical protein